MPVDPNSIAAGKCYVTATNHLRKVLEVTDERVRFAYGDGESGGFGQWRWQSKAKFANDAAREVSSDESPAAPAPPRSKVADRESAESSGSAGSRSPSGSRPILTKRR
jgi:hypothetical protein